MRVPFVRFAGIFSLVCFVVGILVMVIALFPAALTAPIVSLHYNIHFGVDAVGAWWRLFVPSALAAMLTLGNFWYAARVWQREHVIAYAFLVATVLVNIFVLLHIICIVLLNLSYV